MLPYTIISAPTSQIVTNGVKEMFPPKPKENTRLILPALLAESMQRISVFAYFYFHDFVNFSIYGRRDCFSFVTSPAVWKDEQESSVLPGREVRKRFKAKVNENDVEDKEEFEIGTWL